MILVDSSVWIDHNCHALHRNWFALLYSDRDFDPFVEHLGLVSALHES
jgi:hypothetical protein